ncbi:MAG: GNAT family N-acetyltransferase [Alphaproteobacteria bacterium]|jgi:putative hemolysin|nr:GNAT family N-acetyltransferase [Thalassospira sp.]MCE2964383.1 GNAT family N-acetyltransferase [Alphaproteobacteria bacterium]
MEHYLPPVLAAVAKRSAQPAKALNVRRQLVQADLAAIRIGDLAVRLADGRDDITAAQMLRYRVFYDEMNAQPTPEMARLQRDFDALDEVCDHLLVVDTTRDTVVGTYRLITRAIAIANGGFYTAHEYDISCLETYPGEVLELGRSCVDAEYRTGSTMQLLWRAIATYVTAYGIELMFGCASLPGVNPDQLRLGLSYLHHHHLAEENQRPVALPSRRLNTHLLLPDQYDAKEALMSLPPLVKGYLRVGGRLGDGAVVDWQFNTTDVCMVVKTESVADKYLRHYRIGGVGLSDA